jgi:hypothetical protein
MARRLLIPTLAGAAVAALAVALRRIARPEGGLPDAWAPELPPPAAPSPPPEPAPPGRRGPTRAELYAEAKRLDIEGRSKMTKAQLQRAIDEHRGARPVPA